MTTATASSSGGSTPSKPETPAPEKKGPAFFKVNLTHPDHHNRTVFRSVSESRARKWLADHFPRGSEAHLVSPDGTIVSHEAERAGENGADAEKFAPFDPTTWVPTNEAPPPGDSEWADKEG